MGQKKLGFALLVSSTALALVACGGGGSAATGFTDVNALKSAMANPTGTVSAETAVGVAAEFEAGSTSGYSAGLRQKLQAQSTTQACTEGGNISVSGNQNYARMSYNSCGEGGCVMNGYMNVLVNSATETDVSACFSVDINGVCADTGSAEFAFSGCMEASTDGSTFSYSYLIEFEGETYTVSGDYYGGSGSLTITGVNGSFTCSYTSDSGTCTSTTGESFEFTPASASETTTDG